MEPFLRWAGGKRWFVASHEHLLPRTYGRYIEPFLGGGSLFFHLAPKRASLSDTNADLIDVYKALKADWALVVKKLRSHALKHSPAYYQWARAAHPRSLAGRAARFIYLNRTCFNGLYRVNQKGMFNVPMGDRSEIVRPLDDFAAVARRLRRATITCRDFEPAIAEARKGDFVFADPPYTVAHDNNGFLRYNETLFSWNDQERLARVLHAAARRGVHVVATNANHATLRELYSSIGFSLVTVSRSSAIAASPSYRAAFQELLLRSPFKENATV